MIVASAILITDYRLTLPQRGHVRQNSPCYSGVIDGSVVVFLSLSRIFFQQPREGLRCTSETAGVDVPGLTLIKGFVTEEEEGSLLKHFVQGDDVRWTGPLKRRVQHFG